MVALFGWSLSRSSAFGSSAEGERLSRVQASPRHDGSSFRNPVDTPMGLQEGGSTAWQYLAGGEQRFPKTPPPIEPVEPGSLVPTGTDTLRITWMGHSSMLVEIDGKLVLTDPVWGPRASPFSWMGPKRFHRTPVEIEDLPPLDAVLLSHDHYDHLDLPTIERLRDRDVPFFVPLGLGAHLEGWGIPAERITELDWWDEVDLGGVRLVSTPARHFSGRGVSDRNATLWTSWAMVGPRHRVWFSGDTGPYDVGFEEIGRRLGPFDATMIEIGAWHPSWGNIHLGPEAAARVHEQVRGRTMIPVHWGTFNLALHSWDTPIVDLQRIAVERGIELGVPIVGGSVDPARPAVHPFWKGRAAAAEESVAAGVLAPAGAPAG